MRSARRTRAKRASGYRGGGAFHDAAKALDDYATTLSWAQGQAGQAISLWNSGPASRQAAQEALSAARNQLTSAANTATAIVGKARDLAPQKPGFWSDTGSFFTDIGHGLKTAGETFVNEVASVGNAIIQDPGDVANTIGGLALVGVSGLGDGAGGLLDVTGVGALVGVPLNAVSTAGVVGGLSLAGVGVHGILQNAAGPDQVNIMHSDSGGGGGRATPSYTSNVGKISKELGYTPRQINDAIHDVKVQPGWRGLGGNKNPDVVVDTSTGEVYPKLPDGTPSEESIGNLYDSLEKYDG